MSAAETAIELSQRVVSDVSARGGAEKFLRCPAGRRSRRTGLGPESSGVKASR